MTLWQEAENRQYGLFLLLFCLLFMMVLIGCSWLHTQQLQQLLILQEQTLVSGLLQQGVDGVVISQAMQQTTSTVAGETFLAQLGWTNATAPWLLPVLWQKACLFRFIILAAGLLLAILLLTMSLLFLERREQQYQQTITFVGRFADGDFSQRLDGEQTGSFYQLLAAIDSLAVALESKGQSAQKAKQFLERAVSDISHQLKTPLAALQMYMEILEAEPEHADTVRLFTKKAMGALNRMERLLQTLLKLMQLDAGNVCFHRVSCHMEALAQQAVADLQVRAQREGKQIRLEGDPQAVLCCDPGWTCEALSNLLKNGLDHTDSGGIVRLQWQHTSAGLRLTVEDNGTGIAPEDLHHIFKRFYRAAGGDQQGVGLGLPLAKAVFEGQNGVLSVQSALGCGTVFSVLFLTES